MKTPMKRFFQKAIVLLLISSVTSFAVAAPAAKSFRVNPTSLRTRMIDANTSVLIGLNNVHQAKEQVNVARGQLLPSVNVGAAITGLVGGGPSFALTAVSFLLPFLLPSNWYNLAATRHQFVANGHAYHIVQLNTYASAYALYNTILGDMMVREVLVRQVENYERIKTMVSEQMQVGSATARDLFQATGKLEMARAQLAQADLMITQNKAVFRKLLSLPLNLTIEFEPHDPRPLSVESESAQAVLNRVHSRSPEFQQINALIEVSKNATWSRTFNFLSGSALSVSAAPGASHPSFNSLGITGSAGLGFDYFPAVRLSNLNMAQMRLRAQEIKLEEARIIESTLGSLRHALLQYNHSFKAENEFENSFQAELQAYQVGATDLIRVLDAANSVITASVTRARARVEVNNQRVNLHRLTISGQFASIPRCRIDENRLRNEDIGDWFEGFFNPNSAKTSVDEVCRPRPKPAAASASKQRSRGRR